MLTCEYEQLIRFLASKRGDRTCFFVFADTVAAKSYSRPEVDGQGWLGIRFQTEPGAEPSQIVVHAVLTDKENVQQQEALGLVGVNLVYGARMLHRSPEELVRSLIDNLAPGRVEIDVIELSGPAFEGVDNRLMALKLVQHGLSCAAMFTADGAVVQPAEILYKKHILIERGSFRPVTHVTVDMLRCALAQFIQEPAVSGEPVVTLLEMTLRNLTDGDKICAQDFLDRADILGALGKPVLISNYGAYHRLASYLFRHTKKTIGLVLGVPTLKEIFEEKYYTDLSGGILESFGRLFKNDLKMYVYPLRDPGTGSLISAGNLRVAPHLRHLYAYLVENRLIESMRDFDQSCLSIFSRDALARIRNGDESWREMVPDEVAELIASRRLLGYQSPSDEGEGQREAA